MALGILVLLTVLLHTCTAFRMPGMTDELTLLQSRLEAAEVPVLASPEERLRAAMELASEPDYSSNQQPMINFGDAQYVSYIKIGKQWITGIIDTGSFELVVFGAACMNCFTAAHYNHQLSNTYKAGTLQTQMAYGSGPALCMESVEDISMGPFTPKRQMFWEVTDANMPVLQQAAFESIIGVGPTEAQLASVWNDVNVFVDNITSYFQLGVTPPRQLLESAKMMIEVGMQLGAELPMLHTWDVPRFSICMGSLPNSDGVVIWNDTLALTRPEIFVKLNVTGNHTWSTRMTKPMLSVGGTASNMLGCEMGCDTIIDSGTSLIAAPSRVIESISKAMDQLDVNCTNLEVLPDLNFRLDGKDFSLSPAAYLAILEGEVPNYVTSRMPQLMLPKSKGQERTCQLMMIDMGSFSQDQQMWILGMPFFRKYYVTFELGRTITERKMHVSHHSQEDCVPEAADISMSLKKKQLPLRRINAKRLSMPERLPRPGRRTYTRVNPLP